MADGWRKIERGLFESPDGRWRIANPTQKRLHELVRVSYVKVAEYQARGLVHVHPLIRLDRRMPAYRADEVRPPDRRFTAQLLEDALRNAAVAVSVLQMDMHRPEARRGQGREHRRMAHH